MVHNGIEYGIMQLIAETYDLLHRGLGLTNAELADTFDELEPGRAALLSVEITAKIFRKLDDKTGKHLVDVILDVARQKGTGKWTSQDAMDLQVPLLTIDAAVALRDISAYDQERAAASRVLPLAAKPSPAIAQAVAGRSRTRSTSPIAGHVCSGFRLLRKASQTYDYDLDLATVARIWRGGCIIRAALLEPILRRLRRPARPAEPAA